MRSFRYDVTVPGIPSAPFECGAINHSTTCPQKGIRYLRKPGMASGPTHGLYSGNAAALQPPRIAASFNLSAAGVTSPAMPSAVTPARA